MSTPSVTAPDAAAAPRVTAAREALLQRIANMAGQCDRCGSCLPVCPLFEETGRETASARGKVSLVRGLLEGAVSPAPDLFARLDFCLQCRACTNACPSKIRTDELVSLAKGQLAGVTGRPAMLRAVDGFLARPKLVSLAGPLVRAYARSAIRPLAEKAVLKPVLHRLADVADLLPGRRPFGGDNGRPNKGKTRSVGGSDRARRSSAVPSRGKIRYLAGCFVRLSYPEVMRATTATLRDAGYQVVVVDDACCGLPHWSHGDLDRARNMAASNLSRLSGPELVVTDCASCGSALMDYARWLAGSEHESAAKSLAARVRDVSVVLASLEPAPAAPPAGSGSPEAPERTKVTYHDPCHLSRGQGIKAQPRQVLCNAGYEVVEMKGADVCCGGSGTFCLEYQSDSQALLEKKTKNILATGAEYVVTSCPSCLLQLEHGMKLFGDGKAVKVIHLTEAIQHSPVSDQS